MSKTIEVGFPAAGFSFMSPAVTRFSPLSHHLEEDPATQLGGDPVGGLRLQVSTSSQGGSDGQAGLLDPVT